MLESQDEHVVQSLHVAQKGDAEVSFQRVAEAAHDAFDRQMAAAKQRLQ